MTTTSYRMKRPSIGYYFLAVAFVLALLSSCVKSPDINKNNNQPFSYSSDVLDKWMTLQLRLMRNATGIANHAFSRHFAYSGIAALESLKPGLPAVAKWSERWNGLTGLPVADNSKNYYYPANVNAALATINRAMFPNANATDKLAIDSLESALNESFLSSQPQSLITTSAVFGKAVATAVYQWSETDGYKNANNAYTAPTGPGLWKPTAPAYANPATPYWGNNRNIIRGSTDNAQRGAPIPYSTEPNSPFYQMVKQVYDVSQNLTADQKAMVIFWRDIPGTTSPGHWLSIVQQLMRQSASTLDKGAVAYALTGVGINDALIACFKDKYQYNLVRPSTYITEVMGHTTWTSFIGTPAHPEYVSAHASLSAAAAAVAYKLFGDIDSFTDHTYDYLGLAARTYSSLEAIGKEAGKSRLYAGIHYLPSINAGLAQGKQVAFNIFKENNNH